MTFVPWVISFAVALCGVAIILHVGPRIGLLDRPNHRSLHRKPTVRSGGLGLLVGVAAGWGAIMVIDGGVPTMNLFATAAALVAAVSFWDDLGHVPAPLRLSVHLLVSATPIIGGYGLASLQLPGIYWTFLPVIGGVITILFVAWFINLFNFMDGMDGFAGGMAAIGFASLTILGLKAGALGFALAVGCVSVASCAFLILNMPPAKIFMGDVGSATLGFLAGSFILLADRGGIAPVWVGVLVFGPFVADATLTLIRRALEGEAVWEAHSSHYYQLSVKTGWTHGQTLIVQYPLMLGAGVLAVLVVESPPMVQWVAAFGWVSVFFLWVAIVGRRTSERGLTGLSA